MVETEEETEKLESVEPEDKGTGGSRMETGWKQVR